MIPQVFYNKKADTKRIINQVDVFAAVHMLSICFLTSWPMIV